MAIIKVPKKRAQQMQRQSQSLVSTGRSQAEDGDEFNSNPSSNNNQTITVRSSYEILNPLLCEACGQRFRIREELFNHLRTHINITQHISEPHSSTGESPTEPEPRGPNGLITRPFLELLDKPPSNNDDDEDSSTNSRRKKKKVPTPDLTLRVGLKARRGRPRTRPLPPGPSYGPSRQFLWFKEFATNLQLAGENVGTILGDTGSVDRMASVFQTLTDEELELKLGI